MPVPSLRRPRLPLSVAIVCAVVGASSLSSADPPRRGARASAPRSEAREARSAGRRPAAGERELPQECAMDPFHADYGGLERGARVRLGRHRSVDGDAYWAAAMDEYVGRVTSITGPRGVDEKGCPLVAVAVDGGEYDWRIRDLQLVSADEADALASVELSPGFAGDPRTFSGVLSAEEPFDRRSRGCPGVGSHAATLRLTLGADFERILFLAHGEDEQDLVLLVRTPDGEYICADDVDDLDPVISGNAAAGVYEIWVGGYDEDAEGSPFRVGVSEKASVRADDLSAMNATAIGESTASAPSQEGDDPAEQAPPRARPAVGRGR